MLYPSNFECLSVCRCPCFRALTLVSFDLFSSNFADIGIGEEWCVILGNVVTSQYGALLSDDIKALKTNRQYALPYNG